MAIKDFFKNVGNSVKSATEKVTGKIDDAVDVQKLKYRIGKKEEEIASVYTALGKRVIEAVYKEEGFDDDIAAAIAQLESLREEMETMNAERRAKEKVILCPNCAAEIARDHDFCPKCGAKLMKDSSDTDDSSTNHTEEILAE